MAGARREIVSQSCWAAYLFQLGGQVGAEVVSNHYDRADELDEPIRLLRRSLRDSREDGSRAERTGTAAHSQADS